MPRYSKHNRLPLTDAQLAEHHPEVAKLRKGVALLRTMLIKAETQLRVEQSRVRGMIMKNL